MAADPLPVAVRMAAEAVPRREHLARRRVFFRGVDRVPACDRADDAKCLEQAGKAPAPQGNPAGGSKPACMSRAKLADGIFSVQNNGLRGVTYVTHEVTPQAVDIAREIAVCHAVTPVRARECMRARAHAREYQRDSVTRTDSLKDRRGYGVTFRSRDVTCLGGGRR